MKSVTKIKISKPASDVFQAIVDPAQIGNFWFSSSSQRWEQGKTVTLCYDEYDAQVAIHVAEIEADKKISFRWGSAGEGNLVTIRLEQVEQAGNAATIVEVSEDGFDEDAADFISRLLDNKEGWVYMLTCLKGYLEFGVRELRAGLVKG